MLFLAILILGVASVGFYVQDRSHRTTLNNTIGAYEASLAWERTRFDSLLIQVQANSQGLQHYPQTYGPREADTEPTRLVDDFGFDTGLLPSDDDRDYVDAATV